MHSPPIFYTAVRHAAIRHAAAVAATLTIAMASNLPAAQIDLVLNLIYDDPTDDTSGGQWQVAAAADEFGVKDVGFALSGINAAVSRAAPFGEVNSGDDAGFAFFDSAPVGSRTEFIVAHSFPPTSGEVGEFYGFGTLTNGSPDLPGAEPVGVNVVPGSPEITTLTNTSGIPWA
ncbi:MAG: hypothetical protein AAGG46_06980, partial [Planctomycetota bacterium]